MGRILGLGRGKRASNLALSGFDFLKENPLINQSQEVGGQALNTFASALGLQGPEASEAALDTVRSAPGFQFGLETGRDAVTSSKAAGGMLKSGDTLRRLTEFGQEFGDQRVQSFLDRLQGTAAQGQTAATAVGAAGTSGGSSAAANQPKNQGILGRFFGI